MTTTVFHGVGVALVTLFGDDGSLDTVATADLALRLVDDGVRAVLVAGTTGEASTLSAEERVELLDAVRKTVPPAIPVLAGTGASSTREAVGYTREAIEHGADAVLALTPPGSPALPEYYDAIATAAAGRPVLGYHFPAVSSPGIPVEMLDALAIDGLKDSSGDAERLLEELATFKRPIYTGSSALLAYAGPLGCTGAILSLANVEPRRCAQAFRGDVGVQRALTAAHVAGHHRFPRGLKELLAAKYGTSTFSRVGSA
ncbi:MAG: dihydrodipicolinate synthase family protein [Acidimicrobiia bacterium]